LRPLNRLKLCLLVFVWTLTLFGGIILFEIAPILTLQKPSLSTRAVYRQVSYSGSRDNAEPVVVYQGPRQLIGYTDLVVRFRLKEFTQWANMFQTSLGNNGIRMELFRKGKGIGCALLVGTPRQRDGQHIQAVSVSENILKDRDYHLRVYIDYRQSLYVYLDQELVGTRDDVHPELSSFVLGNGFDGTRPFRGDIFLERLELSVHGNTPEASTVDVAKRWSADWLRTGMAWLTVAIHLLASLRLFYFIWYDPA
jgi:hypothetical protein